MVSSVNNTTNNLPQIAKADASGFDKIASDTKQAQNTTTPPEFEKIATHRVIIKELSEKPLELKFAVENGLPQISYKEEGSAQWKQVALEYNEKWKSYESKVVPSLMAKKFVDPQNGSIQFTFHTTGDTEYSFNPKTKNFEKQFDGVKDHANYSVKIGKNDQKNEFYERYLYPGVTPELKQYITDEAKTISASKNAKKYGFDSESSKSTETFRNGRVRIIADDFDKNGKIDILNYLKPVSGIPEHISIEFDVKVDHLNYKPNANDVYDESRVYAPYKEPIPCKGSIFDCMEEAARLAIEAAKNSTSIVKEPLPQERKLNSKQNVEIILEKDIEDGSAENRIEYAYETSQKHNLGYQPTYSFDQAYNYLSDCVKARGGKPLEQITISTHGVSQDELYRRVKALMDNGILAKNGTLISDSCNNAGTDPKFTPKEYRDTKEIAMQKWNTCKMIPQKFEIDFYASTATESVTDGFDRLYHFYPDGREPTLDNTPYNDEK